MALKLGTIGGVVALASNPAALNFAMQFGRTDWLQRALWASNPQILGVMTGALSGIALTASINPFKEIGAIADNIKKINLKLPDFKSNTDSTTKEDSNNSNNENSDNNADNIDNKIKNTNSSKKQRFYRQRFYECDFQFIKRFLLDNGLNSVMNGNCLYCNNGVNMEMLVGKTYEYYLCLLTIQNKVKLLKFNTQKDFIDCFSSNKQ